MRILFYQDTPSLNSTLLTYTLIEELKLRGHIVDYGKPPVMLDRWDWVHGSGQDSWPALEFSRKVGAKCHIHLEGVPYWRIGLENAVDWGYEGNHSPEQISSFREHYRSWMSAAYEADSCTVNGANQVKAIEWLFSWRILPNCHLISCGADARFALTLPDWPKLNYMVTASRLEPNKKVFMIAEALAYLFDNGVKIPPWMIIGYGTKDQYDRLMSICKNKVEVWFRQDYRAAKWRWIKRARMMLCGWSGIPPAEGILCKMPVLSFNHPDTFEMFEDTIWWAQNNDIQDYADKVKWLLEKTEPVKETGVPEWNEVSQKNIHALNRLTGRLKIEGQPALYACTQEQAAERYEKIFFEGITK